MEQSASPRGHRRKRNQRTGMPRPVSQSLGNAGWTGCGFRWESTGGAIWFRHDAEAEPGSLHIVIICATSGVSWHHAGKADRGALPEGNSTSGRRRSRIRSGNREQIFSGTPRIRSTPHTIGERQNPGLSRPRGPCCPTCVPSSSLSALTRSFLPPTAMNGSVVHE